MARIAIVNASNGFVLGSDEDTTLDLDDNNLIAEMAQHVASSDPAETRTFAIWRLPMWEGMTEAEYYTLPCSIPALEAAGAVLVRAVTVLMDRDFMKRWG
jgi:hypothetical protein